MKKCNYCGHEERYDATCCSECGQSDFSAASVTETTRTPQHLLFRFAVGIGSGSVVAALAIFVAWLNIRDEPGLKREQALTREHLQWLDSRVTAYREKFGTNPSALAQVRVFSAAVNTNAQTPDETPFYDEWRRPLHYRVDGTNFLITSYGRDDEPGGKGLDSDLTNRDPRPAGDPLPLRQFLFEAPSGLILVTCIASGFFTFLLVVIRVKGPVPAAGIARFAVKLIVTLAGAVVIGALLASIHVPPVHNYH